MTAAVVKDGELCHFDAGEPFLDTNVGKENKIYGLVQTGSYSFNIFCDDKFEQADQRVFRKFDDIEKKMVVFVHVDDILAHTEATMERFAAELGEKFIVKSMGETFVVEKTSRKPALSGVSTLSSNG